MSGGKEKEREMRMLEIAQVERGSNRLQKDNGDNKVLKHQENAGSISIAKGGRARRAGRPANILKPFRQTSSVPARW